MAKIDLAGLSPEERRQLLEQLQSEDKKQREDRKEAYETLRNAFMKDVFGKVELIESEVVGFKKWLDGESESFKKVMSEYGMTRFGDQTSYTQGAGKWSAVPEPTSGLLMLLGMAGLALRRKRA